MPPLKIWHPNHNVLTDEPLRLRTSDGEISWDKPGPLFGPDDGDPATPVTEMIGRLVARSNGTLIAPQPVGQPGPATGLHGGRNTGLQRGRARSSMKTGKKSPSSRPPISELDFIRSPTTRMESPRTSTRYIGRPAAQVLGKALFWDMQVGSDGVQACGSCHFHAGADNRTKNQLNPNHLGGDHDARGHATRTRSSIASDFPFHKLATRTSRASRS